MLTYRSYHVVAPGDDKSIHNPIHGSMYIEKHNRAPTKFPLISIPDPRVPTIAGKVAVAITQQSSACIVTSKLNPKQHYMLFPGDSIDNLTSPESTVFYGPGGVRVSGAPGTYTPTSFSFSNVRKLGAVVTGINKQIGPSFVDAGLLAIEPNLAYEFEIPGIGLPKAAVEPVVGMKVKTNAINTGVLTGMITNTNASASGDFIAATAISTKGVIETNLPTTPGDEGCLVVNENNEAIGMAIIIKNGRTYLSKATAIEAALNVSFDATGKGGKWVNGNNASITRTGEVVETAPRTPPISTELPLTPELELIKASIQASSAASPSSLIDIDPPPSLFSDAPIIAGIDNKYLIYGGIALLVLILLMK